MPGANEMWSGSRRLRFIIVIPCLFVLWMGCSEQPSKNSHSEWKAFNSGLPDDISVLVIDQTQNSPHVLYIGTFDGIFKHSGSGDWVSVQSGLPLRDIRAVTVHPQNADQVYCGTWGRGLYRSQDGGEIWNKIWQNTASQHISCITLSGSDYRQVWVGTENGVYYSSDRGDTWHHVMESGSVKTIKVHPVNPDIVFVGVDIKGNFKTTDRGQTWQSINAGVYSSQESIAAANAFVIHPDQTNRMLMSTGWIDLYQSLDAGQSWTKTGDLLTDLDVQDLIQDPVKPDRYWAATRYNGVYISENAAVSWDDMNNGLPDTNGAGIRIHDLSLSTTKNRVLYAGLNSYGIYTYAIE